jgi:hypothetical protein
MPFPAFDHSLSRADRVLGLLTGGALGDALGTPIRLMSKATIDSVCPEAVVIADDSKIAPVTDLTRLMLATVKAATLASPGPPEERASAMQKATHHLAALVSAGPIGLLDDLAFDRGCELAARTGGDLELSVAAGLFADWVQCASEGRAGGAAIFSRNYNRGELWRLPEADALATEILCAGVDVVSGRVSQADLGIGYSPQSALLLALWAIARADSPLDALHRGLYISGPSDVVGCLVGQVLGAHLGASWIPPALLRQLDLPEAAMLAADAADPFMVS